MAPQPCCLAQPAAIETIDFRGERKDSPRYLSRIDQVEQLSAARRERLRTVTDQYAFRANEYYLSLIDWNDPEDPIRKISIPDMRELTEGGHLDPSSESRYAVAPGLEHKYGCTAVMLVNGVCGGICRFCFRKRLFINGNREVMRDIEPALDYLRAHTEINNVLLSGGDPLLLSTAKLGNIISELRRIEHVQVIRIGSKMPAFNPFRILEDPSLLRMLRGHGRPEKKIYLMSHFNHPRELTPESISALNLLQEAGVVILNQTPLLRGVNSQPAVLGELFNKLSYIGV